MKNNINTITSLLVIIGAINLGVMGALNTNIISTLFTSLPIISTISYIVIGLSGLYLASKLYF